MAISAPVMILIRRLHSFYMRAPLFPVILTVEQ